MMRILIAAAVAAFAIQPAVAQSPVIIKFSHVVAPDTPKGNAAEKFKELSAKYTGGRAKIEVYANSTLYKDKEEVEALQLGAVLLVGGLGMVFLSNGSTTLPEVAEFFYVGGSIAGAFGAGFLVSAIAAYILSTRLGLLDRQPARTGAQDNA